MRKLDELKFRGRLDGFAGEVPWSVIAEKSALQLKKLEIRGLVGERGN